MKNIIKNILREIYWAYQGKGLKILPLPVSARYILYVCKGNICRSPFAERLTKALVGKGISDFITIQSAGINATVDNPPPKEAIDSAKIFGISMDDHRAQRLTNELIIRSDVIVVMEVDQLKYLEEAYPEAKEKYYLLSLYSHERRRWGKYYSKYNIEDPYGKNNEGYILCYERIKNCINNLLLVMESK